MTENRHSIEALADNLFPSDEADSNVAESDETRDIDDSQPDTEESEAPKNTEEKPEYSVEDLLSQLKEKEDLIAKSDKRIKDNQRSYNQEKAVREKLLNRLISEGKMDENEAKEYITEASTDTNPTKTYNEIGDRTRNQLDQLKGLSSYDEMNEAYESFVQVFGYDPALQQELVNTPEEEQLAFIIENGKKATDVTSILKEHDGNVLAALKGRTNSADIEAAEKAAYERGFQEAEEKYKEYVSSTKSRPNLKNSAPDDANDKELNETGKDWLAQAVGGRFAIK